MPRQTITFSEPNHEWLQSKVDSKEFSSHTEAVNDALRRVRDIETGVEWIRGKLIKAERNGFTDQSIHEIWTENRKE